MALLHISFFSKTLMRTIPLSVYLPSDAVDFNNQYLSEGPYKALVLLHGVLGSDQGLSIKRAFFDTLKRRTLPSSCLLGKNHFHVDQPWNYTNYGEFIGGASRNLTPHVSYFSKTGRLRHCRAFDGGYGALLKRHQISRHL